MPTIAGFCITKDEEENIGRLLSSVMPQVDKFYVIDTGSTDKTVEIARNFNAEVIEVGDKFIHPLYEGGIPIFNFDEAKNFAIEQIPQDYFFWCDADDELLNGQNLRKLVDLMETNRFGMMYCRYIYYADFDEKGNIRNINIEHLR